VDLTQTQPIDRERMIDASKNGAKRIVFLTVLAIVVAWLQGWLGYLGTVIVVFFLALVGVFLVRSGYLLILGLVALMSELFSKEDGTPKAILLLAVSLLSVLEGAVCIGLALYVIRAAGWWTGIQVPVFDEYQQRHF